ncbi:hypothetical protein KFL_002110020 [Klebsormidium nitens]|uniref:Uncharacterized protein n=1 Tax=Klebsormidium nitens TaxID=105231 RepID=A0A1Y1I651_KLENI|nr:hypothetical protein KFL_002110020 [Klebsormidium nitens]|eukprot:GAQ84889.1 hypothetical protein KFL_002110020 [Klebsormidium nitens]
MGRATCLSATARSSSELDSRTGWPAARQTAMMANISPTHHHAPAPERTPRKRSIGRTAPRRLGPRPPNH